MFFAYIFVGDIGCAGVAACLAIGIVGQILFTHAVAIGEHTGRASVIGMKVTRRTTAYLFPGNPLTARENHLGTGQRRSRAFADIQLANIGGPGDETPIIHRLFDARPTFLTF